MPTYDLSCPACGHRRETFVPRMIRDDDKICPECGSPGMKVGVGGGFLGVGASSGSAGPSTPSCGTSSFG
jgi:putative FmdB family regulatory protein